MSADSAGRIPGAERTTGSPPAVWNPDGISAEEERKRSAFRRKYLRTQVMCRKRISISTAGDGFPSLPEQEGTRLRRRLWGRCPSGATTCQWRPGREIISGPPVFRLIPTRSPMPVHRQSPLRDLMDESQGDLWSPATSDAIRAPGSFRKRSTPSHEGAGPPHPDRESADAGRRCTPWRPVAALLCTATLTLVPTAQRLTVPRCWVQILGSGTGAGDPEERDGTVLLWGRGICGNHEAGQHVCGTTSLVHNKRSAEVTRKTH